LENCSDKKLVIRLHKGDVKSFDTLYHKYHKILYLNIFKLTKEAEATQDILQDTFITLWEKRQTIDENKPITNWLFTVSFNKSINYLKKVLSESVKLKAFQENEVATDDKEINLKEIQLCLIESAVKNLSPQRSKVFDLCKLQGKTYEETAKELNISKHTVKEYLVEAVGNIKEYVQKHPESSTAFFLQVYLLC
jgi:RNA polymerase sigma-70 factor (family 1)